MQIMSSNILNPFKHKEDFRRDFFSPLTTLDSDGLKRANTGHTSKKKKSTQQCMNRNDWKVK